MRCMRGVRYSVRGQFGEVHLCVERATDAEYAVKRITKPSGNAVQARALAALQAELAVLMSCEHKHIVRMVRAHETATTLYVVLEYAKGGALLDRVIDDGPYSERHAARIVRQILSALEYLHARGIAHRDLKPENILLASSEPGELHIKLSDFGLSKVLNKASFLFTPCGTPGYVAPEVLFLTGYGVAVDMWSVGVVTYVLLSGYLPFSGKSPNELYEKIKHARYRFHTKYWSEISVMAKDFVRRLFVVRPDERMTASEALQHPWLMPFATPEKPLSSAIANLRRTTSVARDVPPSAQDAPVPPQLSIPELDDSVPPAEPAQAQSAPADGGDESDPMAEA